MSDLLNKASLVVIPSGYKEDTVYSVVPSDRSGDLSFTRASNGTRVNSAGLVEVCPWNLAQYSNTFSNGVWVTGGYGNLPTLTANSIANPVNGLTDAWTASFAAAGTQGRLLQLFTGLSNGVPYTYSMYIKAGTKTSVAIYSDTATVGLNAIFNLSNGTISSTSGTTATIAAMTNGWYYVTITNNILSSGNGQYGIVTNTGEDGTLYIYGAKLNIGSTAKPYFPTTDRLNVPRLTYQNGGGGCPSLLLEKQSTNLIEYSNCISAFAFAGTFTANAITSPEGVSNAFSFLVNAGQNGGLSFITLTTSAQSYTFSAYLKGSVNGQKVKLYGDLNGTIEEFTLTTDWVRYTKTFTGSVGAQSLYLLNGSYFSPSQNNLYYGYGFQLEVSSYATSLIPSNGSSATRVADSCFKTGISSLIGQSEGTIYWEGYVTPCGASNSMASVEVLNTTFINLRLTDINRIELDTAGLSTDFTITSSSPATSGTYYKIAGAYKSGDNVLYVNGVQIGTSATTYTTPTLTDFNFNVWNVFNEQKTVGQAILFKTRLTNAELASLTTI